MSNHHKVRHASLDSECNTENDLVVVCVAYEILLQGVVTCMSCVKVFVTRIKIESRDQSPFLRADQGMKVTSELRIKNTW